MTEATPGFPSDGEDLDKDVFLAMVGAEPNLRLVVAFTAGGMQVWSVEGLSADVLASALREVAVRVENRTIRRLA